MRIGRIINNYSNIPMLNQNSKEYKSKSDNNNTNIETSIYNQKGLAIAFCRCAKGIDSEDQKCILMLRKFRKGRCRKFPEDDIQDIINSLQSVPQKNKLQILNEIFSIRKDDGNDLLKNNKQLQNDKNEDIPNSFIKNLVSIISNKKESERFAFLNFAKYELNKSKTPMKEFFELKPDKQNKLIKLINEIEDIDYCPVNNDSKYKAENLYEDFNLLVKAEHKISRAIQNEEKNNIKIDTLKCLRDHINTGLYDDRNIESKSKDIYYDRYRELFKYAINEML